VANRSYLYSTNAIPGTNVGDANKKLIGISEWNYDIPLVYKILLSGEPVVACKSLIWEAEEKIAVTGDFLQGVRNLVRFLQDIHLLEAQPLIREAMTFLTKPENQSVYFVLECTEIFEMQEGPLEMQNSELVEEIKNIDPTIKETLLSLNCEVDAQNGGAEVLDMVRDLGLGNWSNYLYYEPAITSQ
jgi:hypothetical protein